METIYLKLVVKRPGNMDLRMSLNDIRKIPCHHLKAIEYEEKLIAIEYKSAGAGKADIAAMHMRYLARMHNVVSWAILDPDQVGAMQV